MNQSNSFKVAVVQHACNEDRESNLAASERGIHEAAQNGAQLVLLPELHCTPYFCKVEDPALFDLAEAIPGPASDRLGRLAAELGVVIVASLFERRAAGIYHNTAIVLDSDGSIAGRYRKMHIPDDPGYYEKFYFTPGDQGFVPIDCSLGRLGVLVCWDQWYPEAARLMALAGAEVLLYPSAIGWDATDVASEQQRQREAWITIQRGHAIANGLPLLATNRVGQEPNPDGSAGPRFWGASFICGPQGEMLAQAGTQTETLVAELELARTDTVRRIWPFLRDRRIDAYQALTARCLD